MQKYLGISEVDLLGGSVIPAAPAAPAVEETEQAPDSTLDYVEKTLFIPDVAEAEPGGPAFIGKALGLADVNEAIQTIVDNNSETGEMQAPVQETAAAPAAAPEAAESDFKEAEPLPVVEEPAPLPAQDKKRAVEASALTRAEYEEEKEKRAHARIGSQAGRILPDGGLFHWGAGIRDSDHGHAGSHPL
jgi:hypothetical protein